jgi:UDPglucose--hexose-1-phosphate uridylyltransferase
MVNTKNMADFSFLKDSGGAWVISAPKRSKRPDQAVGVEPDCPFEVIDSKIDGQEASYTLNEVNVINNLYPFAPIHEIVILSNDHRKSFGDLDYAMAEDAFKVYQLRSIKFRKNGQVFIFHNHGKKAGESLPHPHSQITVIPNEVDLEVLPLRHPYHHDMKTLNHFTIYCPHSSQWPDEVWVAPRRKGTAFYEASPAEIKEIAFTLSRLVQIFTIRHGHNFPYNFYISPGHDWYLRLIPRVKVLGGFELGSRIFVNTQDPHETFRFIENNFDSPNFVKIKELHQAEYSKAA